MGSLIERPAPHLGSRTSGVDGSSEGGRIDSIQMPNTLMLYAMPLLQELRARGYRGKPLAEPVLEEGIWCLRLVFEGEPPARIPERWHGHRVIVEVKEPPPAHA